MEQGSNRQSINQNLRVVGRTLRRFHSAVGKMLKSRKTKSSSISSDSSSSNDEISLMTGSCNLVNSNTSPVGELEHLQVSNSRNDKDLEDCRCETLPRKVTVVLADDDESREAKIGVKSDMNQESKHTESSLEDVTVISEINTDDNCEADNPAVDQKKFYVDRIRCWGPLKSGDVDQCRNKSASKMPVLNDEIQEGSSDFPSSSLAVEFSEENTKSGWKKEFPSNEEKLNFSLDSLTISSEQIMDWTTQDTLTETMCSKAVEMRTRLERKRVSYFECPNSQKYARTDSEEEETTFTMSKSVSRVAPADADVEPWLLALMSQTRGDLQHISDYNKRNQMLLDELEFIIQTYFGSAFERLYERYQDNDKISFSFHCEDYLKHYVPEVQRLQSNLKRVFHSSFVLMNKRKEMVRLIDHTAKLHLEKLHYKIAVLRETERKRQRLSSTQLMTEESRRHTLQKLKSRTRTICSGPETLAKDSTWTERFNQIRGRRKGYSKVKVWPSNATSIVRSPIVSSISFGKELQKIRMQSCEYDILEGDPFQDIKDVKEMYNVGRNILFNDIMTSSPRGFKRTCSS